MSEQLSIDWDALEASPLSGSLRRAYRYRLAPNPAQAQALDAERRAACRLYNAALQERIQGYRWGKVVCPGPRITRTTQSTQIKHIQDSGKDSGQKLTDVSYRRAAGPCNPLRPRRSCMHDPYTIHPIHMIRTEVFTKPLATLLV
jgi:hypothetical protein